MPDLLQIPALRRHQIYQTDRRVALHLRVEVALIAAPEATDTGGSVSGAGGFVTASPDDAGSLVPPKTASDAGAAAPGETDTPSVADVLNGATDVPDAAGLAGQDIAAGEAADEPAAPVGDFGIANVPIPTPRLLL